MSIEQLQQENAALKQDLKTIKTTVLFVTDGLKISNNGVFPDKMNISVIVKSVIKELSNYTMPSIFGGKKENIIDKIDLKPLIELLNKHKNL